MKENKIRYLFIILIGVAYLNACAVMKPNPNNPIRTLAVLPMLNQTNDVEGPEYVRVEFDKRLSHYFYVNKPLKDIDQILKDQMGITLGAQLDMATPQQLGELLNVDAVIYGTLMNFETQITGIYNVKKVRAKFKMVNTKTGETVWQNGIGIKSETTVGGIGSALSLVSGVKEMTQKEDIPWITIGSKSMESAGDAFLGAMAEKVVEKALKIPLKRETVETVNRIIVTLPVGPGK